MKHRTMIPAIVALAATACGGGVATEEVDVIETGFSDYYDPCLYDEDCPLDTNCHDLEIDYGDVIVGDAMCTVACGSDFDCPLDGICLGANSGPPLCYQPCFDDLDCPSGFGCVQDTSLLTFDPVCMPI